MSTILSPRVVRALLQNRNLTEEDVLIIANRTNLPQDILEMIAKDRRWSGSYPIRLALARNPRSPLTVSLSVARFLRIFDLEEITQEPLTSPWSCGNKVETMIMERVPTMPLGNKKTLAKKAAGNVLLKLLQDRHSRSGCALPQQSPPDRGASLQGHQPQRIPPRRRS